MRVHTAMAGLGLLAFMAGCAPMPTVALQATPADLENVALGRVEGTFKTTFECGTGEATGTWTASKKAATPNAAWR